MLKNAYFWKKTVKFHLSVLNTRLPPASGGSAPQTPALLLSPTITNLSAVFLALNAVYDVQKEQNSYSKCAVFASSALLHLFHFKLCSFCCQGAQEYFLPQGAGYPSYGTAQV